MKILNDKKIVALLILLLVFTIGYFIVVNKLSYAFSTDYDASAAYDRTINVIKECAIAYGKKNTNLFQDENIIYIKVQDLIDADILIPNQNGSIINPLKENETLNSNVIKIKLENDNYTVEIDT